MERFNLVWRNVDIVSTTTGRQNQILANVTGLDGETDADTLVYGAGCVLFNPKPGSANGLAAVGEDALYPVALSDKALSEARGAIPSGTGTLAGYEGQHVTVHEGAVPGQPKITIEVEGARAVFTGGLSGATVDVTGAGTAENVALYAPIRPLLQEVVDTLQLLIAGDPTALPTPVPGLAVVFAALPGGPLLSAALVTQLGVLQGAATAALSASIASSAVLRASPL